MLRDLTIEEMGLVSGGNAINNIMGSMYHEDAHNGPGGLYGPGGALESQFKMFDGWARQTLGISGMEALSNDGSEHPEWYASYPNNVGLTPAETPIVEEPQPETKRDDEKYCMISSGRNKKAVIKGVIGYVACVLS